MTEGLIKNITTGVGIGIGIAIGFMLTGVVKEKFGMASFGASHDPRLAADPSIATEESYI